MIKELLTTLMTNTSRYLSRIWNRHLLVFVFFLILSTAFWFISAGKEIKELDFAVRVSVVGIPDDVVVTTPPPSTINLRLRDEVITLLRYKYLRKDDFHVELQWEKMANDEGVIDIAAAEVLKPLTTTFFKTTEVVLRRPDAYRLFFNHGQSKRVKTRLVGTISAGEDYDIISTELSPATVTVYAAPEVLDTLQWIETVPVSIKGCTGNTSRKVTFNAPPGIKVVPTEGAVTITADRYVEKRIQVPVRGINFPAKTSLRAFPPKVDVVFQVGSRRYQEVGEEAFDIVVDYNQLPAEMLHPADNKNPEAIRYVLTLSTTPFGVRLPRIDPQDVECIIEHE